MPYPRELEARATRILDSLPPDGRETGERIHEAVSQAQHELSDGLHLVDADLVPPAATEFAWAERIAIASLTIMAGRPGLGKTTAAVEVAARLTRGELAGALQGTPTRVAYATAEDALSTTLVPRLIAAQADLKLVSFVQARTDGYERPVRLPDDVEALGERTSSVGARLLVVDPLSAFLDVGVNAHREADVRRALAPLAQMAELRELAVLGIMHLNKGISSDALTRVSGSVAFTGAPRSVLVLGADPGDPDGERGHGRVLAQAKSNLGPRAASLSCRIESRAVTEPDETVIATSRMVLGEECSVTASEVLAATGNDEDRTARSDAAEFLRGELDEVSVRSKELFRRANEHGIKEKTLRRAKGDLGVHAVQRHDGWYWELPRGSS